MIRHHFYLDDRIAVFVLLFEEAFFHPVINRWNKHLPPVLRAKDNLVFAAVYQGSISVQFIRNPVNILTSNTCSVNSAKGIAQRATFSSLYPTAEAGGFYGALHKYGVKPGTGARRINRVNIQMSKGP